MKITLLIVGKSFSEMEASIKKRGFDFIALIDGKTSSKKSNYRYVDFRDRAALDKAIEELNGKVQGLICIYENYVVSSSYIAKRLGLPGLTIQAAQICTDKELMRQAFAAVKQNISAKFTLVENEADLLNFAKNNGYPITLKPANLTKSLLVTKSRNEDELIKNYRQTKKIIDKTYHRYAPGRQPKILAEEFLEGPAYSVDAFVDSQGRPFVLEHVVDYQTGYDIGYDDNFHYSRLLPSKLPVAKQEKIRQTAALGIKALKMLSSPAHVEVIYTNDGPKIIEIGARNGGYRQRMHQLSNGLDLYSVAIDVALGKSPKIKARKNESCAVLELFPKKSGTFVGISEEKKLKSLPSLVSFKIKQPIDQHVGKSSEGYKMCAIIILHNKNRQQFDKDLDFVNSKVKIITN